MDILVHGSFGWPFFRILPHSKLEKLWLNCMKKLTSLEKEGEKKEEKNTQDTKI